jgi:PAS domain S-box-containing protein
MKKPVSRSRTKQDGPVSAREERLAGIIASAMDAIITVDEEEKITIFNAAAERMFRCTSSEALGRNLDRFIPARFRKAHSAHIQKFGASEHKTRSMGEQLEVKGLRSDGEEFPVEASISHFESDGEKSFTVILRDITDRLRADEMLRVQAEKLAQQNRMLDHAPVLVRDVQNRIIFWNHGAEQMYGFTSEQALGRVSHELLKTRFPEPIDLIDEKLALRREWEGELVHTRADGVGIIVLSSWIRHEAGEGIGGCVVEVNTDITERKQNEEAIERFAAIVQNSDDAIISKTLGGVITSWNPAAERMFGYSAEEAIGKPITFIFPPERYAEEAEMLARINRGELISHFETVRLRKDGRRIDISATISPLRDKKGKIIGASKILRDITEQRRSEQQLRLLRTCMANINDIIMVTEARSQDEPDPTVIFINEAMERILGYSSAEVIGFSPAKFLSDKTDPRALADIREAIKNHRPIRRQVVNRCKDGRELVMDADISPIFDALGRCTHYVGIHRDVTELNGVMHRIEEQAKLLDQTQDAILVRDLDGKVVFWNKAAERIYGWTAAEAVGRNVSELIYADTEKFREMNALVIEKGEWTGELRHVRKDRRELNIEARWSIVRDKEGRPVSVLAVNTDVTEKKKIESQFMRAQRMESIGVLAGGIAHDLNNILAPIILSLDMLKETATDQRTKVIVETIEISARRGADIVAQVLSFARGVEGRRVEIQCRYLLRDLEHIIKDTFPKNIRLHLVLAEEVWTVAGDPTQIHQILLNLCVNARDAMPDGGTLTIGAENRMIDEQYVAMNIQAKAGPYVVLSVTDSGTGIPAEIIDKIFEPFYTTKEIGKGTGLGLSTVLAIVKSHDGFINVYSEPGHGTTFKIYIPAETVPSERAVESSPINDLPRGRGETILIVDDEAGILTITGQTLEAFGYRVLKAANGAEAVAIYAQHRQEIAVVLTDMAMPVMDGPATIYALLKINPDIKIIAASGLYANGGVARAASAGVEHFISKPYTASILLKTLEEILRPAPVA